MMVSVLSQPLRRPTIWSRPASLLDICPNEKVCRHSFQCLRISNRTLELDAFNLADLNCYHAATNTSASIEPSARSFWLDILVTADLPPPLSRTAPTSDSTRLHPFLPLRSSSSLQQAHQARSWAFIRQRSKIRSWSERSEAEEQGPQTSDRRPNTGPCRAWALWIQECVCRLENVVGGSRN